MTKNNMKHAYFHQVIGWKGINMTRRQELLKIFESVEDTKGLIMPMIDDVIFLECQLENLRRLPFIRVNPADPSQQKTTPAAKQYRSEEHTSELQSRI